ncbi:hypothetical protein L195_g061678, partial [Trifolium pratense]
TSGISVRNHLNNKFQRALNLGASPAVAKLPGKERKVRKPFPVVSEAEVKPEVDVRPFPVAVAVSFLAVTLTRTAVVVNPVVSKAAAASERC